MKHILITDTHADYARGADWHHKQQKNFYENVFFPYMEKNGITSIIHLGDFFDNRTAPNMKSVRFINEVFIDYVGKKGYDLHIIMGNHDVYHKNTNLVNSLENCINNTKYPKIKNVTEPLYINNLLLVPWITKDNYEKVMQEIRSSSADICLGHFEFQGFPMMKGGIPMRHGMSVSDFKHFKSVLSGHYHTSSHIGNIIYLGSTFQFTKADMGDIKCFYLLDEEDLSLTSIETGIETFLKIELYDYKQDIPDCKDKFVYLDIASGVTQSQIDKFKEKIYEMNPNNLIIDNDFNKVELPKDVMDNLEKPKSMRNIIDEYIEDTEISHADIDKGELKERFMNLYEGVL